MELIRRAVEEILNGAKASLNSVEEEQVSKLIDIFVEAKNSDSKIMVIGAGRSGLVGRAFAMRLMHLTFNVYVIGETITPALGKGDILFAISGSGETSIVVTAAKIAKEVGARIVTLTSYPKSPLGLLSDHLVTIQGRTKVAEKRDYFSRQILGVHEPLAPLGTMFEIACTVFLDSLIVEIMRRLGMTEADMKRRHATIE